MPLQETLDTYRYLISEANKLNLSYIVLVRYSALTDITLPDGTTRGTQHDVLESYRSYITNPATRVFLNCGLTPDEGAKLIEDGKIDGATYGVPILLHPDFGVRVKNGKPLDNQPNWVLMQIGQGDDPAKWDIGYTDYPASK